MRLDPGAWRTILPFQGLGLGWAQFDVDRARSLPSLTLVPEFEDEVRPRHDLLVSADKSPSGEGFGEQHHTCRFNVLAGYPLQDDALNARAAAKPLGLVVVTASDDHPVAWFEPHRISLAGGVSFRAWSTQTLLSLRRIHLPHSALADLVICGRQARQYPMMSL